MPDNIWLMMCRMYGGNISSLLATRVDDRIKAPKGFGL